jgi:hypothetical protein
MKDPLCFSWRALVMAVLTQVQATSSRENDFFLRELRVSV